VSAIRIANRYAKALYRIADGDTRLAHEFLGHVNAARALFDIEPAAKVLESPVMPQDLKKKLFAAAFNASGAKPELQAFVGALIAAGRVNLYPAFCEAYARLINEAEGIVLADVTTAVEVDAAVIKKLSASLEKILGTKIQTSQQTDPSLLGGFVVRLGNKMIDMSVKTKLEALTKSAAL
jgi:F-type H+-transporting ATPase subunit delta